MTQLTVSQPYTEAIKHKILEEREKIIGSFIVEFNIGWLLGCVFFVYLVMKFQWVRKFLKEGLENGDDKGHHEDLTKSIIIASSICMLWTLINTLFASMFFIPDGTWYTILGIESGVLLGLLGLKKL